MFILFTYNWKRLAVWILIAIVVRPSCLSLAVEGATAGDPQPINVSKGDPPVLVDRTGRCLDGSSELEIDRTSARALEHCGLHQKRPFRNHNLTVSIMLTSSAKCVPESLK